MAGQPFAALVNVAEPSESRILKAPLAKVAHGWGQIEEGGWSDPRHPDYQKMRQLVAAAIAPLTSHDIADTCGRDPCICDVCWVRHAREAQRRSEDASKPRQK